MSRVAVNAVDMFSIRPTHCPRSFVTGTMISSRAAMEIISISLLSFVLLMSNSCLVMATVGSNCTDSNCIALSETCDRASNSCICNTGYTDVSSICKAGLNYPCFSSVDCYVAYAECQNNASSTCQCKSGYSNVLGVCKAGLNYPCFSSADCNVAYAECQINASSTCQCKSGYSNVLGVCKAGLNYPCFSSADCNVAYAECQINASNTCQCKSGYSNVLGVCKADLGSECTKNSEPKCTDVNAQCSGSCECKVDYYNSHKKCTTTSDLQVRNLTVTTVMETSLFVRWENPVKYDDVSKYKISWKRLNANDFLGTEEVSKANSSVNLSTNLTAAVAYNVTVTSYESSGIYISTFVQQATKPYKPDRIDVNGSNFDLDRGSLNITWQYSGTITGIDIRFKVLLIDSRSSETINTTEVTTNYVTFPTTGLKNGYRYNVSITARSEEYTSPTGQKRVNSDVFIDSFKTTVKVPDPPSSLDCLNASDTYINLKWMVPNNPNGDIRYYDITVNMTSPDSVINNVTTRNNDLQYTVMNLTAGSFYTFEVYTVNEEYRSRYYAVVINCETTAPVADKPVDLVISNKTSRSGSVTWKKPSNLSGVLYGYSLQIRSNEICIKEVIWKCSNCQGIFPNLTLRGCSLMNQNRSSSELGDLQSYEALELYPDMNYSVIVSAITKPGRGLANNGYLITLEEAPQKPYNIQVSIAATKANVTWNITGPRPGNTTYNIMLMAASPAAQLNFTVNGFSNTSYELTGLEEYWNYTAIVHATTRNGSNRSDPFNFTTLPGPAGNVSNCVVSKGSGGDMYVTAKVSWKLPAILQRNGPIKSFYIQQEKMIDSMFEMINNVSVATADDDRTYIHNFQVQPEKLYRFNVSAFNGFIGVACSLNYTAPAAPVEQQNVGALAGGIVGGVVAVLIVIAVVIFFLRRKSNNRKSVKSTRKKNKFPPIKKERPIQLSEFADYVDSYHKNSNLKFSAEYEDLKTLSPRHPHKAADLEVNHQKNRFFNILPFDHSRVKLLSIDDVPGSDYINANYIQGFTSSREYIACQGPIPSTIDDHWRLIWEQNVHVIVMLTKYNEKGMVKCERYIPAELNDSKQYGDLVVELLTCSSMNSFEYRTLKVTLGFNANFQHKIGYTWWPVLIVEKEPGKILEKNTDPLEAIDKLSHIPTLAKFEMQTEGEKERTIKHFHFLEWNDFSANVHLDIMIDFIKEVRNVIQPPDLEGPMIIHCSAGVGRTGTFISIDFMIQQIDKHGVDSTVDIFDFVLKMRENRTSMVQTEEQYIFIHDCVKEYLNRLKTYENQAFTMDDEPLYQNTKMQLYENVNIDANQNTEL